MHRTLAVMTLVWGLAASARADVDVRTDDGRSWSRALSDLVEDLGSEGTTLRLCVSESGLEACLPCESYTLTIDGEGADALAIRACDAASGVTLVQLIDRSALFDHAHAIPTPRAPTVSAIITSALRDGARASSIRTADAPEIASPMGCIAIVRAFARDAEHGTFVRLSPDRFVLDAHASGVVVASSGDGFVLSRDEAIDTHYVIAERSTGAVVLEGDTTLVCPTPVTASPPRPHPHTIMTSGIQLYPVSPLHRGAVALEYGGFGVAGLGLVTLAVIGILVAADVLSFACSFGAALDPSTVHACGTSVEIPPEVTYTALGAMAVGSAAGALGLGIDATRGPDPGRAQLTMGVRF